MTEKKPKHIHKGQPGEQNHVVTLTVFTFLLFARKKQNTKICALRPTILAILDTDEEAAQTSVAVLRSHVSMCWTSET